MAVVVAAAAVAAPSSSEWLMRGAGQEDEVVFGFEMD